MYPQVMPNQAHHPLRAETIDRVIGQTDSRSNLSYSIIIPAWNESTLIRQTIKSVRQAQTGLNSRCKSMPGDIVVVDNNSTDNTASIATELGATVVFEPVNQIARARNTGAASTDAEFLIFLDADTKLNSSLLSHTLEAMATGSVIGGGSTVSFDKEITGVPRLLVNFWNWWSVRIKAAAGCYLFCTREAFISVGGFDEKRYAAEELVLSKQLRKYAKQRAKQFVIFNESPVISSARKLDWYSGRQKLGQLILLTLPGATRSKRLLGMWYDRSHINEKP